MKNAFPAYYLPSEAEMKEIWDTCLFVLDTNVLLDLYRYSPSTRDQLIDLLKSVEGRIWLPHQVAKEFLKNRPTVMLSQTSVYSDAKKILEKLVTTAQQETEKNLNFRVHPFIDKKEFLMKIADSLNAIAVDLDKKREEYNDSVLDDKIVTIVTELFEGKVGLPYQQDELKKIYESGKTRYSNDVPPGYEDARGTNKKEGNAIYNDLVIWFQVIAKAKETKLPIVFITNDNKEDWWWICKRKTISYRPELREEMLQEAAVEFHMYNADRFMQFAPDHLTIKIDKESIEEVRDVRINNEALRDIAKSLTSIHAREILKSIRMRNQKEQETRIIENMISWFYENFKDPADGVPYCSAEGGYQYINGGPYDPIEVLQEEFPEVDFELVEAAADKIYSDGGEWVKTDEY